MKEQSFVLLVTRAPQDATEQGFYKRVLEKQVLDVLESEVKSTGFLNTKNTDLIPRFEFFNLSESSQANQAQANQAQENQENDFLLVQEVFNFLTLETVVVFDFNWEQNKVARCIHRFCIEFGLRFLVLADFIPQQVEQAIQQVKQSKVKEKLKPVLIEFLKQLSKTSNPSQNTETNFKSPTIDRKTVASLKDVLNPQEFEKVQDGKTLDFCFLLNTLRLTEVLDTLRGLGFCLFFEIEQAQKFEVVCTKSFQSLDSTIRTVIRKHCQKVEKQLEGQDVNRVFNRDSLVYKKYNGSFFAYKIAGDRQIRLLLRYTNRLELHKVFIKNGKRTTTANEGAYLEVFKKYVENYQENNQEKSIKV